MIYDLIVVGNGLAAQTFLFELFNGNKRNVNKSQNFSVAQIFSEDIAPACSIRSTATVSLSGIEEGISPLGDELRRSFFLFEEFVKSHRPAGVQRLSQFVTATTALEIEKLKRRYTNLEYFSHPLFKEQISGVKLESYQISPELFHHWFEERLLQTKLKRIKNFVREVKKNEQGHLVCELLSGEKILAKKIILATGAYAKIYSHFHDTPELFKTQVVAGSFLERTIDLLCPSFYITLDGHNLLYRSSDHKLVLGSASRKGAFLAGDLKELQELLDLFNEKLTMPLGAIDEFKIITGLRHKGAKRRPIYRALNAERSVYMLNGFYKNGFTFAHLTAQEMLKQIFIP